MRNVRLFYKKTGRMRFASHLDMNRIIIRLLRLSRLPVWYTEGFNRHPYIAFALPLSLGYECEYDIIDFRLTDDSVTNAEVERALKAVFPEGLSVIRAADRGQKPAEIAFAEFRISFYEGNAETAKRLSDFLARNDITVEKRTKKGTVTRVNIAPFIKKYKIDPETAETDLILAAGGENNLNPALLLSAFDQNAEYKVCRTMIYNKDMERFE